MPSYKCKRIVFPAPGYLLFLNGPAFHNKCLGDNPAGGCPPSGSCCKRSRCVGLTRKSGHGRVPAGGTCGQSGRPTHRAWGWGHSRGSTLLSIYSFASYVIALFVLSKHPATPRPIALVPRHAPPQKAANTKFRQTACTTETRLTEAASFSGGRSRAAGPGLAWGRAGSAHTPSLCSAREQGP